MREQPVRSIPAQPTPHMPPKAGRGHFGPPGMERNDDAQIAATVSRLGRRYTRDQISTAELTTRVRGFYGDFATARIRSFVGIFVERLVRRSIETPSAKP
jgi:hypothetical protein